jgi:hypothetical protein
MGYSDPAKPGISSTQDQVDMMLPIPTTSTYLERRPSVLVL